MCFFQFNLILASAVWIVAFVLFFFQWGFLGFSRFIQCVLYITEAWVLFAVGVLCRLKLHHIYSHLVPPTGRGDLEEAVSMAAMIELYTLPELTVMADYYTSDLGRSAERKGGILRQKIAPKLKEMLDKGVLSVITSPSPAGSVSNAGR